MKKLFPFVAVLFFALLLAGCGEAKPPDFKDRVVNTEAGMTTLAGTVEPLAITIYQDGTHQLRVSDRKTVLIQSRMVNLNRYLGKTVTLKGVMSAPLGNAQPVLDVSEVLSDSDTEAALLSYNSESVGVHFEYPASWNLFEQSDAITLKFAGALIVEITVFNGLTDWKNFVIEREKGEGETVTVGSQSSLRYGDDADIRFYIPNPSKSKVYLVRYVPDAESSAERKALFYDFIENFSPLYFEKPTGKRCGGAANLKCEEGFRCELSGGEKEAVGVCVSLESSALEVICPFIPTPSGCAYVAVEFGANGCPIRYACEGEF